MLFVADNFHDASGLVDGAGDFALSADGRRVATARWRYRPLALQPAGATDRWHADRARLLRPLIHTHASALLSAGPLRRGWIDKRRELAGSAGNDLPDGDVSAKHPLHPQILDVYTFRISFPGALHEWTYFFRNRVLDLTDR